MILAIYTHKQGANYYLLRDDEEVQKLRKEIAQEYWDINNGTEPFLLSSEQVDQYWQDQSESALEWFEATPLTYHYEKA